MKLVNVSCNFDGNKIIFFFTADGRVDFRELVKDLASIFRARIELRQIGVRDEAKMLGGLGICGRPFCCSQFLGGFLPVSIKMAKTQNLSLNPTKISGTCGRLMCCLKYEQEAYEDAAQPLPQAGFLCPDPRRARQCDGGEFAQGDGEGPVWTVRRTTRPTCYHNCEICVLRNGKGSREGIEIPEERPARYVEENQEDTFQTVTSPLLEMLQDEDTPYRVKMGADSEDNKPRRRRSRGGRRRSGSKGGEPLPLEPEPKERGEKADKAERGENRDGNRPARNPRGGKPKSAQAPKKPTEERPAPVREGAEAAQPAKEGGGRRRPHHRGGRRRNRGGGDKGGAAPKAE